MSHWTWPTLLPHRNIPVQNKKGDSLHPRRGVRSPSGLSPCPIGHGHAFTDFSLDLVDNNFITVCADLCGVTALDDIVNAVYIYRSYLCIGIVL